jgi:hypothetical protein
MLQKSYSKRSWLLLALLAVTCTLRAHSQALLGYTYCAGIADSDSRNYCVQYINSNQAETKWNAAVLWSKYRPGHCKLLEHLMQSLPVACEYLRSQTSLIRTSCNLMPQHTICMLLLLLMQTVAQNGAPCEKNDRVMGSCWQGMCGGEFGFSPQQQPQQQQQ